MSSKKRTRSKPELYEAIATLNRNFEHVLADLKILRQFGSRQEIFSIFEVRVEELRAWTDSEMLETQHDRELRDWARFGRQSRKWETRYADPKDVRLAANQSSN